MDRRKAKGPPPAWFFKPAEGPLILLTLVCLQRHSLSLDPTHDPVDFRIVP